MNRTDLDTFRIDIQFLKESLSKLLADEEYLTVDEAAQFLKVSYHMMYDKRFQAKMPHIKVGRLLRFRKSDLIAYLESGRREPVVKSAKLKTKHLKIAK